ncbi:MAG TPA: hypothetical protein VGG10_19065 [Rhizomicrobium sp.]|jgi:hypothetical protein
MSTNLRKPAFVLLAALVALLSSGSAQAQQIGFVRDDKPTTAGLITPSAAFSHSSSGGAIAIERHSKGIYMVRFTNLGNGLDSNLMVDAYGTGSNFCVVGGWGSPNGTDVTANVECFGHGGARADTGFTALYQARMPSDATKPTVAFVLADQPTTATYTPNANFQYNPAGAMNSVARLATGTYNVKLPDLKVLGGTVLVAGYGGPVHCQETSWDLYGVGNAVHGTEVKVNCTDIAGAPIDAEFSLVYSISETAGYAAASANGGAIFASKPGATTEYSVSNRRSIPIDGETMYAEETEKGVYAWTMNVEDTWTNSTVLATAYGAPGNYCKTQSWESTPTITTVLVGCFDAAGHPAKTRFTATFQLAGVH